MNVSLPYGPPMNIDIEYHDLLFGKSCEVNNAICVREEKPVIALSC